MDETWGRLSTPNPMPTKTNSQGPVFSWALDSVLSQAAPDLSRLVHGLEGSPGCLAVSDGLDLRCGLEPQQLISHEDHRFESSAPYHYIYPRQNPSPSSTLQP